MTVNPKPSKLNNKDLKFKVLATSGFIIIYAIISLILWAAFSKGNQSQVNPNVIAIAMLGLFTASVCLIALLFGILWGIWRKDNAK